MMIAAIQKRYLGMPPSELAAQEELCVDSCKIREISPDDASALRQFPNLRCLSCSMTGLSSIGNLPPLPITKLQLQDNRLSVNSGLAAIGRSSELVTLRLGGNRIRDFTDLDFLEFLPKLEKLELEMNPIANVPNYRHTLFSKLPNLKVVDGIGRNGEEGEDSDSVESDEAEDPDEDDLIDDTDEEENVDPMGDGDVEL